MQLAVGEGLVLEALTHGLKLAPRAVGVTACEKTGRCYMVGWPYRPASEAAVCLTARASLQGRPWQPVA